jgi:hypothetical protein
MNSAEADKNGLEAGGRWATPLVTTMALALAVWRAKRFWWARDIEKRPPVARWPFRFSRVERDG